jgi:hypothetical protein
MDTTPLLVAGPIEAATQAGITPPAAPERFNPRIADLDFMAQLTLLRDMKAFIYSRAVKLKPEDQRLLGFGKLNLLRAEIATGGRPATEDEWRELDERLQGLNALLSDAERREFRLSRTPGFVNWLAGLFLAFAVAALAVSIFPPNLDVLPTGGNSAAATLAGWQLAGYLTWLFCLGGIGSIAFIGVNALAIQADATFDLANPGQVLRRVLLGALFGIVLALPFGYSYFLAFCNGMADPGNHAIALEQGISLLVPFVLGFSSSLVMLVLNRLVQGAETVFGIRRGPNGQG